MKKRKEKNITTSDKIMELDNLDNVHELNY